MATINSMLQAITPAMMSGSEDLELGVTATGSIAASGLAGAFPKSKAQFLQKRALALTDVPHAGQLIGFVVDIRVRLLQRHYRGPLFVGEKRRTVYGPIQRGFEYLSLRRDQHTPDEEDQPHNESEDASDD